MVAEISEYQEQKDKMMVLQQQVALMEEDVAKEKGKAAGEKILVAMRHIATSPILQLILEIRAHLDAQEKQIKNLEKEKEALSQKYSTDPEIIR